MRKNSKKEIRIKLCCVVLTALLFCRLIKEYNKPDVQEQFIRNSLAETSSLHGLSSKDLYRFRSMRTPDALCPADIQQAREVLAELKTLWEELRQFKDDPDFIVQRFAVGTRFHSWRQKALRFWENKPDKAIIGDDLSVAIDQLLAVSNDYAGNAQMKSSVEEWFVNYYLPMAIQSLSVKDRLPPNNPN